MSGVHGGYGKRRACLHCSTSRAWWAFPLCKYNPRGAAGLLLPGLLPTFWVWATLLQYGGDYLSMQLRYGPWACGVWAWGLWCGGEPFPVATSASPQYHLLPLPKTTRWDVPRAPGPVFFTFPCVGTRWGMEEPLLLLPRTEPRLNSNPGPGFDQPSLRGPLAHDLSWSLGCFCLHCPSGWGKHIREGKEYSWLLAVVCAIDLGLLQAERGALQGRNAMFPLPWRETLGWERLCRNSLGVSWGKRFLCLLKSSVWHSQIIGEVLPKQLNRGCRSAEGKPLTLSSQLSDQPF